MSLSIDWARVIPWCAPLVLGYLAFEYFEEEPWTEQDLQDAVDYTPTEMSAPQAPKNLAAETSWEDCELGDSSGDVWVVGCADAALEVWFTFDGSAEEALAQQSGLLGMLGMLSKSEPLAEIQAAHTVLAGAGDHRGPLLVAAWSAEGFSDVAACRGDDARCRALLGHLVDLGVPEVVDVVAEDGEDASTWWAEAGIGVPGRCQLTDAGVDSVSTRCGGDVFMSAARLPERYQWLLSNNEMELLLSNDYAAEAVKFGMVLTEPKARACLFAGEPAVCSEYRGRAGNDKARMVIANAVVSGRLVAAYCGEINPESLSALPEGCAPLTLQ